MKYFITISNLFIGVVLFVIAPKQLSAQFVEAELTQDSITYFYEQPLVHLKYNRYRTPKKEVYIHAQIPIILETQRVADYTWMDVRVEFEESDGVNLSDWSRDNNSSHHFYLRKTGISMNTLATFTNY